MKTDADQQTGSIKADEMPRLLERHVAQAQLQQAQTDLNLLKAVELACILTRLEES